MGKSMNMAAMFLMLVFLSTAQATVFDITRFGGKQNGDITKALAAAFKAACASTIPAKVVIPKGTFRLAPIIFDGPCKSHIEFVIHATLLANTDTIPATCWVTFNRFNGLALTGGGVFDGLGAKAWGACGKGVYCKKNPMNLSFNFVENARVHDLTTKDSKQFHVNVFGCKNFIFKRFTIIAPADSANTDGIHIGKSVGVHVTDSHIGTGDDCVSIGDGNRNVTVTGVTCGPGHGISIGSLGRTPGEEPVVGVHIKNCTLINTDNGVRIKTWPASNVGVVTGMHFEDIIMKNVANPVVIDQIYCPWNQCNAKLPSRVKLSNISFKRIRGTSASPVAVKLACSSGAPCQKVEMADINLTYSGKEAPHASSLCSNVRPHISGRMYPPACTGPVVSPK